MLSSFSKYLSICHVLSSVLGAGNAAVNQTKALFWIGCLHNKILSGFETIKIYRVDLKSSYSQGRRLRCNHLSSPSF